MIEIANWIQQGRVAWAFTTGIPESVIVICQSECAKSHDTMYWFMINFKQKKCSSVRRDLHVALLHICHAAVTDNYIARVVCFQLVFIDTHNSPHRVWVSQDEGESYVHYNISFLLDKVEFHPSQQNWLLGYDKHMSAVSESTATW